MPLDVTGDYYGDPEFSGLPLPSDSPGISTGRSVDLGIHTRQGPPREGPKDWQKFLAITLASASDALARKGGGGGYNATGAVQSMLKVRDQEQTAYQRYMVEYDKMQTDRMNAFTNMRTQQMDSGIKALKLASEIHKMAPDASDQERERIADAIHEQAMNAGVVINQGVFRIIARRPDVANDLGELLPYASNGAGLGRGIIMLEAAIRDGKLEEGIKALQGFVRPFVTEDLFDTAPDLVKQAKALTGRSPTFDEFLPLLRSAGATGPAMARLARGDYGQSEAAHKGVRDYLTAIGVTMPETVAGADKVQREAEARKQGEIAGDPETYRATLAKLKADVKRGTIDISGYPGPIQARLNADPEARALIDAGQKPTAEHVGKAIAAEEAALREVSRQQGLMAADVKEATRVGRRLPENISERMGSGIKTVGEAEAAGYNMPDDRKSVERLSKQNEFTKLALKQTDKVMNILTKSPEAYGTSGELAKLAEGVTAQAVNFMRLTGVKVTAPKDIAHYEATFSKAGITNAVIRSQILALAFLGAEAKGFEGRELTDKKIELEIEQIGTAGQSPYAAMRVLREYRVGLKERLDAEWTGLFGKQPSVSVEGRIDVRRKSDGLPGDILLKDFDPQKYERVR